MAGSLLPASILPGLLEIALKSRLNIQALFDRAGIDPDVVGRHDQFITLAQLDTLLSSAFSVAQDDPFFGLRVGQENHYGNLDLLGNLMATAGSLREALNLLLRYKDLLVPYLEFELIETDDQVVLASTSDEQLLQFTRTRTHNEVVVATMVAIGNSLMGGKLGLRRVCFRHRQPADISQYETFFQVPLQFGEARNEIVIAREGMDVALPTAYPRYNQRLRRVADQQLARLSRAQGLAGQVQGLLEARLGQPDSHVEAIASSLNLSARTLQRRLRREGVTFAELRDQVRHRYARAALAEPDCDMEQLACSLGFSDTANFYHAFKRWEGCAPGAYRRRVLG
ncbi:AraC family transcriptional regulator [Isoalcanivorax indicus]|uniref:AraC family transcriptional regulator n=1 Tax=Isoalcanivorax indicus TaxID=2202653 RepID=UPI000DBA9E84|nr:AraC family transcriptional regulator [Isoalcanivorax indicus]